MKIKELFEGWEKSNPFTWESLHDIPHVFSLIEELFHKCGTKGTLRVTHKLDAYSVKFVLERDLPQARLEKFWTHIALWLEETKRSTKRLTILMSADDSFGTAIPESTRTVSQLITVIRGIQNPKEEMQISHLHPDFDEDTVPFSNSLTITVGWDW